MNGVAADLQPTMMSREGWDIETNNAFETWTCLQKVVLNPLEGDTHCLIADFMKVDRKDCASMDDYINRLVNLWSQIKFKLNMPETLFVTVALNGIKATDQLEGRNA